MKQIHLQFLIPGWLITILTFPGVIIHELSHLIFCYIFKIKVYQVKFFTLKHVNFDKLFSASPVGWVIHEKPKKFIQSFFISIGPFIINSFLAIIFFAIAIKISNLSTFGYYFVLWIATSIAVNSFPSKGDANVLWTEGKEELKNKNYLVILIYPLVILIYIADVLRIVWFDFIYAYALYYLVNSYIH